MAMGFSCSLHGLQLGCRLRRGGRKMGTLPDLRIPCAESRPLPLFPPLRSERACPCTEQDRMSDPPRSDGRRGARRSGSPLRSWPEAAAAAPCSLARERSTFPSACRSSPRLSELLPATGMPSVLQRMLTASATLDASSRSHRPCSMPRGGCAACCIWRREEKCLLWRPLALYGEGDGRSPLEAWLPGL